METDYHPGGLLKWKLGHFRRVDKFPSKRFIYLFIYLTNVFCIFLKKILPAENHLHMLGSHSLKYFKHVKYSYLQEMHAVPLEAAFNPVI